MDFANTIQMMSSVLKNTIEVPDTILNKLICDNCEGYLSHGPVVMLDNGKNRCGRCIKPEEGGQRNIAYEEVASLLIFPCRFKEHGCREKVKYNENQLHEESCMFRPFVCPIVESGLCEWYGVRDGLLAHCKAKHPENVAQNPFKLLHDITKSNLQTYILSAFQVLFLIQTKMCETSQTIYQSVRLIGDVKNITAYKYEVSIENQGNKIVKPGIVQPQGCMVLEEATSMAININGLLQMLGDFQDTTFTLTVQSIGKQATPMVQPNSSPRQPPSSQRQPTIDNQDQLRLLLEQSGLRNHMENLSFW